MVLWFFIFQNKTVIGRIYMTFEGKIIKEKSYDHYFEVEFTYEDDE